jgi:hypothetical protein
VRWCVSFWLVGVLHSANPREYRRTGRTAEACLCEVVCFILVGWYVTFCKSERVHENRETREGVSVRGDVFHFGGLVCCILKIREELMLEYMKIERPTEACLCAVVCFILVGGRCSVLLRC